MVPVICLHQLLNLGADADKEHMATAEQVELLMEGLSMLDVHLQVRSGPLPAIPEARLLADSKPAQLYRASVY